MFETNVQYSMFIVECSMFDVHCSMFNVHCEIFENQCSIFNVRWSLFNVRWFPNSRMFNVRCSMFIVRKQMFILFNVRPNRNKNRTLNMYVDEWMFGDPWFIVRKPPILVWKDRKSNSLQPSGQKLANEWPALI